MAKIEKLTGEQMEQVLHFLLHRMNQDTRRQMMASLPLAYARMYPTIQPGSLSDAVFAAIRDDRGEE